MAPVRAVNIFAEPTALVLLFVVPALWVLGRAAWRTRRAALAQFGDPRLLGRASLLPPGSPPALPILVRLSVVGLAVFALARPQWGRQPQALARTGRDLVVTLDLSRSMKAADADGTRLRTARKLAWQLAAAHPGDRIGLAVFGGAGFLQLPPTSDLATFQLFLDAASPDMIGDPSTDVAAGLRVAERALRREGTPTGSRAVLLLTDGERSKGALDAVLDIYRHARLPVFAIGIGTAEGARVPSDSGSESPWHLDHIGRPVVSHLAEDDLVRIAQATGGLYARWDDAHALAAVSAALAQLEARTLATQPATQPKENFQWPLGMAVLLLLLELSPVRPSRRALKSAALVLATTASLTCTSAGGSLARGQQLYEQGQYLEAYETWQEVLRQQGGGDVRYNAGNALYRLKQYSEAAKTWREALTGSPADLRQAAFFNMGNAFVRGAEDANGMSGYYERAIDAYQEALRLNPADRDAKWNLEIALRRRGELGEEGSAGRRGRADYGSGQQREGGYEGRREAAVGAMAGGGQGGDEGESVEELDPQQARALLEAIERQQLSTHEGHRPKPAASDGRDW